MENPILVVCVDRDNDLFEKAKVHGPVIGRDENVKAATKLALADPEDPDSNAIFYSIKIYDELKKEENKVILATLTGHKSLGYVADKEIAKQLDKIIDETHVERCIFISDGASDEEILPIIKSRIKIDSSKVIVIKQAKELEKTYFVLLEKIRDPYYAKIFIGIPALLIFLLSIGSQFGYGWQPIGILVGAYLILKGFGIEDYLIHSMKEFRFSIHKTSWIAYISALALLVISAVAMYQSYEDAIAMPLFGEKIYASVLKTGILIIPWALLLIVMGKSLDARAEKKKFAVTKYGLYACAIMLTTMMLKIASDWILNLEPPYVSFPDFLITIVISLIAGYVVMEVIRLIREESIRDMKLEGKEAVGEAGSYIGKIIGVDLKGGFIIVQTPFERRMTIPMDDISTIAGKVFVNQ
ncbi:DUF373 family protein [Candidatus Micrarchaeota archaeon]|nr:DUF373 family protein [Candidatus Micrarchaeota archaeon]